MSPLDLHVLGTPPAFVLSQDQTLMFNPLSTLLDYFRNPKQKTHFQNQLSNFFLRFFLTFCIVFKVRARSLGRFSQPLEGACI